MPVSIHKGTTIHALTPKFAQICTFISPFVYDLITLVKLVYCLINELDCSCL
jgi:hypothetical protein